MAALKPKDMLYANLTVYDRTFIETFQSLVNSGNYSPGPLVLELTRDATRALMMELGFSLPIRGVDYDAQPVVWEVWKNPNNPQNQ